MKKNILVTGGAGFIGSNFVHYLYDKYPDYHITVLDALTYAGAVENLPVMLNGQENGRISFWYGNVCNADLVDTLVSVSDVVVHFAAESHVTRSIYDNLLFYQTDVLGTQAVANAILKYKKRVERFIHISTSEVYGTAESEKMSEEHALKPLSPYASAKCGADRLVWSYYSTYQIPAIIVRPFNNYGPRQHLEKVIPRFITSVLLDEPMTVHGEGAAARDFIHAEDHCRALDLMIHSDLEKVKGQVFNLGSEGHKSILEIAQNVVDLMGGSRSKIQFIGERPGQVFRHTADTSKIRSVLGWRPKVSWQEGLKQTIDWYKKNEKWWSKQIWMRHIPIITSSGKRELH
ncbi:MAG: GDP-mannose 4,6-dehydratase [Candidatus Omnitrophica bacterium]|nr:GDP-mannose 4,6-dehydratase [Candidatus Omnitrophota bacterium]